MVEFHANLRWGLIYHACHRLASIQIKDSAIRAKNLEAVLLFVDFSKAFDSVHRGKMANILKAYGIPHPIVNAIMTLYHGTNAIVRSPDGDTDPFNISDGVLQGDTLAPFLFILCLDYVLMTIDRHNSLGFTLQKARSRRHPAIYLTDADYADDIALFADSPEDAEKLLHILEASAANIGLHVNSKKIEYMTFNINGDIRSLNQTILKPVEEFIYLGSNIASSENDVFQVDVLPWTDGTYTLTRTG